MYATQTGSPPRGRCGRCASLGRFPGRGRDRRGRLVRRTAVNRRSIAGACLIASPLLHLVSYFLWPVGSEGSAATQLATAAAHPGAMLAASVVETVGWVLLLPPLAVLWNEVRGRGAALVGTGVWL